MRVIESRWFVFRAKGHENVKATHRTTFEITKDPYLTPRGDCIVGIEAEASASDLPEWLKNSLKEGALLIVVLCSGNVCDSIVGYGSHEMTLSDKRRMVFRRSNYVGPETTMIKASKAARDLRRDLVERLRRREGLTVAMTAIKF